MLDTGTGRTVAVLKTVGDADDIWYDAQDRWVMVSGGEGGVDVFAQQDADQYTFVGRVASAPGARTSLFVSALNRLSVAAPRWANQPAQVLAYRVKGH